MIVLLNALTTAYGATGDGPQLEDLLGGSHGENRRHWPGCTNRPEAQCMALHCLISKMPMTLRM